MEPVLPERYGFVTVTGHQLVKPRGPERPHIVVLGIGHSNTSITSKQLFALGWNAGDADAEFVDSVSLRDINLQIAKTGEFSLREAREALAALPQPWAVKDPRFGKPCNSGCLPWRLTSRCCCGSERISISCAIPIAAVGSHGNTSTVCATVRDPTSRTGRGLSWRSTRNISLRRRRCLIARSYREFFDVRRSRGEQWAPEICGSMTVRYDRMPWTTKSLPR